MSSSFSERDWKVFRRLRESALQRFCERVLAQISDITGGQSSAHSRYIAIYEYIHDSDREMARAFDDPRRSNALAQLAIICANDLLTQDEIAQFSQETLQALADLAGPGSSCMDSSCR